MNSKGSTASRSLCGFLLAAIALAAFGTLSHAEDSANKQLEMRAGGSLVERSASIRMAIDDPVVRRQMQLGNVPPRQSIKKEMPGQSSGEVRIDVPPGSHQKENDTPFFQFRQLQESPRSESEGQFLSQEARKNQVERYRQSLVSATE